PYLVVAADKGTATFSDVANDIAREYGFWMGDAFASGGSAGYDHKKMGITARGGWESVKRHFREFGVDIQNTPIRVIGIGGMAGDVFGNGMLLSRKLKLIAAFDHIEIFLDPDPIPELSYKERLRLFHLPRSQWSDYSTELLSKGGGVFLRTTKSIPISPEVRAALGIESERLSPDEMITQILKAQVDLLWNGGIGTYVKAVTERNVEVGDRANDGVRINGRELRCRVVGEGGNLGFTQLGRVEYARHGGRLNSDFIDNSGGVDCSDREVNIKILLNKVVAEGDMTGKQRNRLLENMTGEVAVQVCQDNYRQAQSLSIMEAQSGTRMVYQIRLMRKLEKDGVLDVELEGLPDGEGLAERQAAGEGFTRPELSVLLAYGKIVLYQQLLASDLPEDPYISAELERAFPVPLREKFRDRLNGHRLWREIIVNQVTNRIVNQMGATFAQRLRDESGASAPDIARAFTWAAAVFDMKSLWEAIEALDNRVGAELQLNMMMKTNQLVQRSSLWFLRHYRPALDIGGTAPRFRTGVREIASALPKLLNVENRKGFRKDVNSLVKRSIPKELANRVAGLDFMMSALDIVEVEATTHVPNNVVAKLYFLLGARLELPWLHETIGALPRESHWQTRARAALRDDLYAQQRSLTDAVLCLTPAIKRPDIYIENWSDQCLPMMERWRQVLGDLKLSALPDYEMLSVGMRELRDLVAAGTLACNGPDSKQN
ncbi:MAG: NAD-glutamate dehydrogenase, partial [Gammaproteobacteria bacterium]|nr:NAD-glutamate dehydrogenase [Gammaproteobacteria bacterium]